MGFSEVETGLKWTNCGQLAHPWWRPPCLTLEEARNVGVTDSVGLARVPSGKAGRSATSSRLAGVRQSHAGRKGGRRPGDACARKEYPQAKGWSGG